MLCFASLTLLFCSILGFLAWRLSPLLVSFVLPPLFFPSILNTLLSAPSFNIVLPSFCSQQLLPLTTLTRQLFPRLIDAKPPWAELAASFPFFVFLHPTVYLCFLSQCVKLQKKKAWYRVGRKCRVVGDVTIKPSTLLAELPVAHS